MSVSCVVRHIHGQCFTQFLWELFFWNLRLEETYASRAMYKQKWFKITLIDYSCYPFQRRHCRSVLALCSTVLLVVFSVQSSHVTAIFSQLITKRRSTATQVAKYQFWLMLLCHAWICNNGSIGVSCVVYPSNGIYWLIFCSGKIQSHLNFLRI